MYCDEFYDYTPYELLERDLLCSISEICNTYDLYDFMYTFTVKMYIILTEKNIREIIHNAFRKGLSKIIINTDNYSDDDINLYDLLKTPTLNSLIDSPSFDNLPIDSSKNKTLVRFEPNVVQHVYINDDWKTIANIRYVKYNRSVCYIRYNTFGRDTTSIYRWDNTPGFDLVNFFLS